MSTLAEIEAAIATLQPEEMERLEAFLHERRIRTQQARLEEFYCRTGVHPLPKRSDAVITVEMVRQLCEEEDI